MAVPVQGVQLGRWARLHIWGIGEVTLWGRRGFTPLVVAPWYFRGGRDLPVSRGGSGFSKPVTG